MHKYIAALTLSVLLIMALAACNRPASTEGGSAKVPSGTVAANIEPRTQGSDTAGQGQAGQAGKCAECAAAGKACSCAEGGCQGKNCANCPAKSGDACKDANCKGCPSDGGKSAAPAGAPAGAQESGSIKLADGSAAPVINVGLLDGDYKNHSGLVAVDGEVAAVFVDKGTFMLKNCVDESMKADGCSKACCAEAQIPVKLDMSLYSGELPAVGTDVMVIGDVSLTETGYTLAVREVRTGEKTILSRKGEKSA
ncbi:hypothetical protein IT575_03720 [bacterium]|nr:hypothetical protein [bacterium]